MAEQYAEASSLRLYLFHAEIRRTEVDGPKGKVKSQKFTQIIFNVTQKYAEIRRTEVDGLPKNFHKLFSSSSH